MPPFTQILDPVGSVAGSTFLALVPVVVLLALLAGLRLSAWQAVIIGSVVTVLLAIFVWGAPASGTGVAYGLGAATGVWSVDWIVFWGVIIYNTLVTTGAFAGFKDWLVQHATRDIRVQTILLAWAFGALMEGLVGFGYPWAVVAPILIALGVVDLAAIRVAAIANNAPVSYGALGAPIIGLAAVTGLPLMALSASVGKIVAILALLPPFVLIYLVSGWRGLRDGWPLAVVGALSYIAGQYPTSQFLGPYLPDVIGSLVCFGVLLVFLRFWRPKVELGFGGKELPSGDVAVASAGDGPGAAPARSGSRSPGGSSAAVRALVPFGILVVVVVAWTGPWSPLPNYAPFAPAVKAISSLDGKVTSQSFKWAPFIAGTAILVSWLLICAYLRPARRQLAQTFRDTFRQMWGALLVGPFIFGLAYVFNYSGMASSMANGFSKIGTPFIVLAPILGWIAVALSGSNTSANAVFGAFQLSVAKLLGAPPLLFPSLNSVGAEVGKPVAPQTASVGVATTKMVRKEGEVIRYNMAWTLVILVYLILIGLLYYFVLPGAMQL
ncbi:L-lactate permease [Pseudonocardia sp. RS11V-5]|uniref:L-lactate permease n=1 Tax=Pseudonocardia terrae TaxID=2905831 RepID=UPI001E5DAE85|nr:L-lactate permease [Pseudonocardia terrae]MCE3553068.1 L-lactate permease [Pseudonocardia terrae]